MTGELASKPASQATFFEEVAKAALQGSITCDGKLSPAAHADYAVQAAAALVEKLGAIA